MGWETAYHRCYHDSKGGHLTGVRAPCCSFFVVLVYNNLVVVNLVWSATTVSLQRRAADRSTSPLHQLSHCATWKPQSLCDI